MLFAATDLEFALLKTHGQISAEMRAFIEEAKASGVTRCPIRDIEEEMDKCPVDMKTVSAADAKAAVEKFMNTSDSNA